MRRIYERVGGLDVHRDSVVACAELFDGRSVEVDKATFSTTATGVRALGEWLAAREVELVVMEATGVYWRPVYYGLEDRFNELWLVNAHHVKNVPGRKTELTAQTMIAEIGVDMSRFPTAGHLAAWAGVAPASHESAGKRRPAGTRQGSRHLREALIEAARAAARTKETFLSARYSRIARRRGPNKAAVAIAHSILVAAHHMLATAEIYNDLGADFYDKRTDPDHKVRRHVAELEAAGYAVTITPAA